MKSLFLFEYIYTVQVKSLGFAEVAQQRQKEYNYSESLSLPYVGKKQIVTIKKEEAKKDT